MNPFFDKIYRAAIERNPGYVLLQDLLLQVNKSRKEQGWCAIRKSSLCAYLARKGCAAVTVLTDKRGRTFRVWHKEEALRLCSEMLRHCSHARTDEIWAPLPELYRGGTDWVTIPEAARRLGCSPRRVASLCKEYGRQRCFHDPVTKRKLCYVPAIAAALPWRSKAFIERRCTPEHARRIFATRQKQARCIDGFFYYFFYVPELAAL